MPTVAKYSGVTTRVCATGRTVPLGRGWPSIRNREAWRNFRAERQRRYSRRRFHAGQCIHTLNDLIELKRLLLAEVELLLVGELVGLFGRKRCLRELHAQQVVDLKSRRDIEKPSEALQQQACADQRNQRECDFCNDQCVVNAMTSGRAEAFASLFQNSVEVAHSRTQSWKQSAKYSGGETDDDRESEHAKIDADFANGREFRWSERG